MADKNLNIIMETDLDLITKFAIAVMEGQYCINNGLTLTRILCKRISLNVQIYTEYIYNEIIMNFKRKTNLYNFLFPFVFQPF